MIIDLIVGIFLLAWGIWCYVAAAKGLKPQWGFRGFPKHVSPEFANRFINIFMGTLSILFGAFSIYKGFK